MPFQSNDHALAVGAVFGLLRASGLDIEMALDDEGNYTNIALLNLTDNVGLNWRVPIMIGAPST